MINIIKFIEVANIQITGQGTTDEAKYFIQENKTKYNNLNIEISFGIGRASAIPWIALLGYGQKVKDGIYPVFLYYKDYNLLILAYGVSESQKPRKNWNNHTALQTIKTYFESNRLIHPKKYGNSFVFKVYNTNSTIYEAEIEKDLDTLVGIYKYIFTNENLKDPDLNLQKRFEFESFLVKIKKSNLEFSKKLITRFTTSLLTKPFVILTGLSGSGKTKLAQAFAMWLCGSEKQYKIVPVGADWTNSEPLLGFPNALEPGAYVKPDSGVLDLIIRATNDETNPYFLILDEMNLSHVERYFADFLSTMESDEEILLHAGAEDWGDVPDKIKLPKNLFIVGTVNIDETTYMFSPKVLDRASVIEFRVTEKEMDSYLSQSGKIDLKAIKGQGAAMEESFVELAKNRDLVYSSQQNMNDTLISFFRELKKAGAEFGYRTASEIRRFAAVAEALETEWTTDEILDVVIMQKLLPKLHGSRKKLVPVLETLIKLCIKEGAKADDFYQYKEDQDNDKVLYPIALEKLQRMYRGLLDNGFSSYAEA